MEFSTILAAAIVFLAGDAPGQEDKPCIPVVPHAIQVVVQAGQEEAPGNNAREAGGAEQDAANGRLDEITAQLLAVRQETHGETQEGEAGAGGQNASDFRAKLARIKAQLAGLCLDAQAFAREAEGATAADEPHEPWPADGYEIPAAVLYGEDNVMPPGLDGAEGALEETPVAAPGLETEFAEIRAQLVELRAETARLQQALDLYLGAFIPDLADENQRLRHELRRLWRDQGAGLGEAPSIPMPDRALFDSILEERADQGLAIEEYVRPELLFEDGSIAAGESLLPQALGQVDAPDAFAYTIIAEWGRTPEEAAELGAGVSSLKGLICVVPAATQGRERIDLGRHLRSEYDAYDNINIEVFDNLAAAQAYEQSNVAPPTHRVMSISKHRNSGRDVILLIDGESVKEIPGQG